MHLYDTSWKVGRETYGSHQYIKKSHNVIIIFDISNKGKLKEAKNKSDVKLYFHGPVQKRKQRQ